MAVTLDILRGWRDPRGVIRAKLAAGVREDRALVTCMGACALIFLAQWPRLAREAWIDPAIPLDARIGGALLGIIFLLPLFLYAIGGISHLVARALGGKGTWFRARLALFWAMLVVTPVMLLHGLVMGFMGPGRGATLIGVLIGIGFLYIWLSMLAEAERGE